MIQATKLNRGCLIAVAAIYCALTQAPQASAMVSDSQVFGRYQASRAVLLTKERNVLRDCDDLQRQLDDLYKMNDSKVQGQINDLCRSLDLKHSDLRRIRQDLRDVELKLL
jgi:hypothetical protein